VTPEMPHSREAEESLLGSIIINQDVIDDIIDLPVEAFYSERHRVIYRALKALHSEGEAIDMVSLTERLRTDGNLDKAGGFLYPAGLVEKTVVSLHAPTYARILREKHRARTIIDICGKAIRDAYDGQPTDEILNEHENNLTAFARFDAVERGPHDYTEGALDILRGGGGLSTGLSDLDFASGGIVKGGVNVLAGRPSMGKSSLMRVILNARVNDGDKVALFSVDQGGDEIYALEAAQRAFTSLEDFRPDHQGRRRVSEKKQAEVEAQLAWLRDEWSQNFVIHDSRAELHAILAKARQEIRAGATVIAVDHIQSLMVDGHTDDTRVVSSVSRAFKALAREFNVTVLLLSQLGRAVEQRPDKRPMMSDLRQSGAIEEDANQIMFVYRDEYYDPNSPKQGIAEIIIAKNKLGRVPRVAELVWIGRHTSFGNKSRAHQEVQ